MPRLGDRHCARGSHLRLRGMGETPSRDHVPTCAVRAPGADPDDVVQEALLRAWQKRATYDAERGSARTWLLALTADQARRVRRRRRSLNRAQRDDIAVLTQDRVADVDLRRAVKALPRRQREAIVLFYHVDLSVQEAAQLMGCSPGTVKSTLFDARARLGKTLEVTNE